MKVYVTQESNLDYTGALEFGDVVFLSSPGDRLNPLSSSLGNEEIIDKITHRLSDWKEEDLLLCTGAPAHMAIAGSVLGDRLKNLLVWDNRTSDYFIVKVRT